MKNKIIGIIITLLALIAASVSVCASDSGIGGTDPVGNQNPDTSMQLVYAKLQLEMAELNKQQAMEKMNHIAVLQAEQRTVSAYLNTAEQYRNEAADTDADIAMPADMAEYLNYADKSPLLDEAGWNGAIASLENRLNQLSMEVQLEMIYVQNMLGQYQSYLSGTNTMPVSGSQTVSGLARGQSMYGDSDAGIAVTCLVVGLVLGCAITLAAQRFRREKKA